MAASARAAAQVDGGEGDHGEQDGGGAVGGGVVEVLDLVVEDDGEGARGAGNVSAEHEDYAELAHGVEKAEDGGGNKRSAGEWNQERSSEADGAGAQQAGGVDQG